MKYILGFVFFYILCISLPSLLPGNPLEVLSEEEVFKVERVALQTSLSPLQTFERHLHLDFGTSWISGDPVWKLITPKMISSFKLGTLVVLLGFFFSLLLGGFASEKRDSPLDRFCDFYGALTASLPYPWIGIFFLYLFSFWIPWFEVQGSFLLGVLTLVFIFCAFWSRLIRNRMRLQWIYGSTLGAKARGFGRLRILWKDAFLPVSGSLFSYLGLTLGDLLTGTFVMEMIFDLPGMGELLLRSASRRDFPVLQASLLWIGFLLLLSMAFSERIRKKI